MESNSKDDCLHIREKISEEKSKDFERQIILEKVSELTKNNQIKNKELKRKNIISNINEIEFLPSILNVPEKNPSTKLEISEISNTSDISSISNFSYQNIYKISNNSFSFINNNNNKNINKLNEIKKENNNANKKTLLNKIEENIVNFFRANFECKIHPNNKYIAYCSVCEKNICQKCLIEELDHLNHNIKKISYFKDLNPSEIQIKYYNTLFIFSKYNLKRIREIIIEICYELSELYEKESILDNKIKIKALQKSLKQSYKSFYIKNFYQLIYIQNIISLFSDCRDLKYLNYQVINNLHEIKINSVKIPDLYKENVIKKTKIMIEFMVNKNNILKSSDSNYPSINYKYKSKIELKNTSGNEHNDLFSNDEKSKIYNNPSSLFKKVESIIDRDNSIFQNEENALSEIISNYLSENIKNKINEKKYNFNLNDTNKIFETKNSNTINLSKKKDKKQDVNNISNIKIKASIGNEDILENISTIFDFDIKKQIYASLPNSCSDDVEFKKNIQYIYYDKDLKKDITCIYHGEFLKNTLIRHGRGLFIWEDRGFYLGYWKNDKRDGKGRNNYCNGNVYQGTYKNGKKEGNGMYKWKNGDIYVGEFKNDLKDGAGKYKFRNGDKYIGSFKNDKIDGNGTYIWANKNSFSGQFKNDKIEGKGIFKYFCSNSNNIIHYKIKYQKSESEDELINNESLKENQNIESLDENQNINKSNSENKKINKKIK